MKPKHSVGKKQGLNLKYQDKKTGYRPIIYITHVTVDGYKPIVYSFSWLMTLWSWEQT